MAFTTGDSVFVEGYGPGIISAVTGGPISHTYHVVLDSRDEETGLMTRIEVPPTVLSPGPVRPTYEVGQRVTYLGRGGTVKAKNGTTIHLTMDEDPPRPGGYPARQHRFVMPEWHLNVHHL